MSNYRDTSLRPIGGVSRRDILKQGLVAGTGAAAIALGTDAWGAGRTAPRIVTTTKGRLRGMVEGGLATFRGIPYGAPTGGPNRFLPPQPVVAWNGVRDATQFGPQSPQFNLDFPAWLDSSPHSEDCLYLNVWSPAEASATARLPVMVWLHGGAFAFGSAGIPFYDCGNLAKEGKVVAVGINHRLSIFGYAALDGVPGSGNAGQVDLVAALRWVRDNIAAFGGDPGNVTIFGESGGGGKVCALLGMPSAKGLFHKAIVQSGSLLRVREAGEAKAVTDAIYRQLNIREGDVAALRRVPTRQLLAASEPFSATLEQVLTFGPVADEVVISGQPWGSGLPEQAHGIPLIVGTNHHEAATFIGADLAKPIADDNALVARAVTHSVVDTAVTPEQAKAVLAIVRASMPNASDREVLVRLTTDLGFWRAAVRQCEWVAAAGRAPVFAYECRWETPCLGGMWSPHGIELPFIFDHPEYGVAWDGTDSDAQRRAADPQGHRFQVGHRMLQAWAAFARTGNPSTSALTWPAYEAGARRTMIFDRKSEVVSDPRRSIREAVSAI